MEIRLVKKKDIDWRDAVNERDNYTCRRCNRNHNIDDIKVEAHHIKDYHNYPELRYELDNGICLCDQCHKEISEKNRVERLNKSEKKSVSIFNHQFTDIKCEADKKYIDELENAIE